MRPKNSTNQGMVNENRLMGEKTTVTIKTMDSDLLPTDL